jgi:LPXTG-motif cell wall-anchored protein
MAGDVAYLIFGATLCVALAGIGIFYFRRHRREQVEGPKYRMLEDDDRR